MNTGKEADAAALRRIAILGAGAFAREVADIYRQLKGSSGAMPVGFVDRDDSHRGMMINGIPVLGRMDGIDRKVASHAILGMGDVAPRARAIREAVAAGLPFDTVIHPSVIMSEYVVIGAGTVICAGSILTNHISLGQHVLVNVACTLCHDIAVGDNVVLCPGVHVSGWVTIESNAFIGTGAVLLPRVNVGKGAIIGAGAVVTKSIPPDSVAVGVPARVIRTGSNAGPDVVQ